jgi:pimeloyl-ACP methyl ester carboxylesterase
LSSAAHTPSPASHSYFSQRLRLHYIDWGNADKPGMVMVHGLHDHCRTWDDLVADFATDFHVVAPDLRGHGDSEWVKGASYDYLDYLYDLHQLIVQTELAPVTLIGHSMGGAIAALFAGIYPELVDKLVVIEGIGLWRSFQPVEQTNERVRNWVHSTRALAARQPRRYDDLSLAYQRMQAANPNLTDEQALHLTVHGSNRNEDGTYSWKYDPYTYNFTQSAFTDEDVVAIWQAIACPTMVLTAERGLEHRLGHDGTDAHIKHGQFHEIADAQHWTYHDQQVVVADLITAFLG